MQGIILREMIPYLLFWSAGLALRILFLHQKVIPFHCAKGRGAKGTLCTCDWGRMLAEQPRSVVNALLIAQGRWVWCFLFEALLFPTFLPPQCWSATWRTATKLFPLFLSSSVVYFKGLIHPRRSKWTVYFILFIAFLVLAWHYWASNGKYMFQCSFCLCLPHILLSILWLICKLWQMQNLCGAFLWWQTVRARKCCMFSNQILKARRRIILSGFTGLM